MSNIEQKKENAVVDYSMQAERMYGSVNLNSSDVIIPQLLLLQKMSELVDQNAGKAGEFVDSLDHMNFGTELEIIPFHMEQVWIEQRRVGNDFEYVQTFKVTPENESLPWEEGDIKRTYAMNFYFLMPSEVEAGTSMPYLVSMRSTSVRAGKKLATQMYMKNRRAGKLPCSVVFKLQSVEQNKDTKKYYVMDVNVSRMATDKEVNDCVQWYNTVSRAPVEKAPVKNYAEDI